MRFGVGLRGIALSAAVAAGSVSGLDVGNTVKLGGYGSWDLGQIVAGDAGEGGGVISHQWTTSALVGVRLNAFPWPVFEVVLSPEFRLYYPFPQRQNLVSTVRPNSVAYINEAQGIFSLGDRARPYLKLNIGMFDYKYNPESRDLGEYLFRTGTYPPWVITDFDFPAARLLGLCASTSAVKNLRADLLFTSEYQFYPLYDFSLSLIASYKLFNVFDIGAGAVAARLLPVDENKTSPKFADGMNDNYYWTSLSDTTKHYYSFKATKLMARACFDPKGFFRAPIKILGNEDLKLYAEIAVIGLDDFKAVDDTNHLHPAYYNEIKRRIPIMVGLNVPFPLNFVTRPLWNFGLLDILSAEVEYFHSGLPNNYRRQEYTWTPMPYVRDPATYDPANYTDPGVRWAVYAKKELVAGFSLTGQIAFDHLRTTFQDGANAMEECLLEPGHHYWVLKAEYSF